MCPVLIRRQEFFACRQNEGEDKRVCPTPFLAKEIKVSTCFTKLESGLVDGDQGHGLLLRHQGPKRVRHEQLHETYSFSDPSEELKIVMGLTGSLGLFDPG